MLRSSAIVAFSLLSWSSLAVAERDPLEPEWSDAEVFWIAKIQGAPVGIASSGSAASGLPAPADFNLRILLRVGSTPVVFHSQVKSEGSDSSWQVKAASKFVARSGPLEPESVVWNMREGRVLQEGAGTSSLASRILGGTRPAKVENQLWLPGSAVLVRHPGPRVGADFRVFSPLSGEFFSASELKAVWDADGWAKTLRLPLGDGLTMELIRTTEDAAKMALADIRRLPLDPQWFTSPARFANDLGELRRASDSCLAFAEGAEKDIKRKTPGIPYILHRRLVNLRSLCSGIRSAISRSESEKMSPEKTEKALIEEIRLQEKESRRELPQALASSPEWSVFSRDDLRSQTIRVAAYFVRRGQAEAAAQLAVEQERKVNLDLRVHAALLENRAVLRGVMKMKESSLQVEVNEASPGQGSGHLLSSAFLFDSKDPVGEIRSICLREKGRVGLDLSSSSVALVRSDLFRGVWDESTKTQLVSDFLLRAFAIGECTNLVLAVPKRLELEAKATAERFRHDILQTENRFQVSNGKFTKFRVMPGTYELTLSSYVNGAKLGQQEFRVSEREKESLSLSFR